MTPLRRLADRVTALAGSVDISGFTPFFAPLMFFLNEKGTRAARVDTRGDTPRVAQRILWRAGRGQPTSDDRVRPGCRPLWADQKPPLNCENVGAPGRIRTCGMLLWRLIRPVAGVRTPRSPATVTGAHCFSRARGVFVAYDDERRCALVVRGLPFNGLCQVP